MVETGANIQQVRVSRSAPPPPPPAPSRYHGRINNTMTHFLSLAQLFSHFVTLAEQVDDEKGRACGDGNCLQLHIAYSMCV